MTPVYRSGYNIGPDLIFHAQHVPQLSNFARHVGTT